MFRYHKRGLLHKFRAGRLHIDALPSTPREWIDRYRSYAPSVKKKALIPSFFVMSGVVYVGIDTLFGTLWIGLQADSVE